MDDILSNQQLTTGFIGAGKTGTALAVALHRVGYHVSAVASRTKESAQRLADGVPGCRAVATPQKVAEECTLVFITTPDSAIAQVAKAVAWRPGQGVIHCSGANSLDILESALERRAYVASFHPLLTFATVTGALEHLPGSVIALEGKGDLLHALEQMAARLECLTIRLDPGDKPMYHAAAVMSCGYITALLERAVGLLEVLGFNRDIAVRALTHLTHATADNIATVGLAQATTGPMARGDTDTIRKHLDVLRKQAPELLPLYCHLGYTSMAMARQVGDISLERFQELERLLLKYERGLQVISHS